MILRAPKRIWMWAGVGTALIVAVVIWRESRSLGGEPPPWAEPLVERDLDAIMPDTLRVLVLRDPLSWEERPQAITGLEFELLERFARVVKVPLLAIPVEHPDSMLMELQRGRGDVIAAQCTDRKDQREWFAFTSGYTEVRPVLARLRMELPATKQASVKAEDRPDAVATSLWSPFIGADYHLNGPPHIAPAASNATPDDMLMGIVLGTLSATVLTDAGAAHEAECFPIVEFVPLKGNERELSFMLRRNAPQLLQRFNTWLADEHEKEARAKLIDSYTGRVVQPGPLKARRGIPVYGDSISPYDAFFRQHAKGLGWDWELLCVMAWKESRFDSTVTSHSGAEGIMQLMPRTSAKLGLDSSMAMDDNIRVAARYLSRLDTLWMRAVTDREQRLRFVLASYNAGPGHVIDAQRLAQHLGLDPKKWEGNVERAILLLAKPRYYMRPELKNGFCKGNQVFYYVRDVVTLYHKLRARRVPDR
ncbi:MAG: transglycosylase SLT domain-containing protein [Flavobacteriales bacterium]